MRRPRPPRCSAGLALLAAAALVGAGCTPDRAAPAAPEERPLVGLLRVIPDEDQPTFVAELAAQGWVDGRDVEVRPGDPGAVAGDDTAARRQLEEWLREGVDLIVASSTPYAALAAEVAPSVPVLFLVNDPVAAGLLTDPDRPEGYLTGVTFRTPADRTLDLASQVLGGVTRVGYLAPADDPAVVGHLDAVRGAADELGLSLVEATFASPEDVPAAVAELVAARVEVVYLASSNATVRAIAPIEQELAAARLPAVVNTDFIDFALVILAPDGAEIRRQLARQAARILGGADVASVPVEDPRRFVTIVDRGVAEQLGLPPLEPEVLRQMDVVR